MKIVRSRGDEERSDQWLPRWQQDEAEVQNFVFMGYVDDSSKIVGLFDLSYYRLVASSGLVLGTEGVLLERSLPQQHFPADVAYFLGMGRIGNGFCTRRIRKLARFEKFSMLLRARVCSPR